MELITLWMAIGFLFAAYSVIANDSVQTLGTWIASNNQKVDWKIMWGAASSVLLWAFMVRLVSIWRRHFLWTSQQNTFSGDSMVSCHGYQDYY